jgi:FtsP/CotA-like multicopper oxidase with cupredoxin domain
MSGGRGDAAEMDFSVQEELVMENIRLWLLATSVALLIVAVSARADIVGQPLSDRDADLLSPSHRLGGTRAHPATSHHRYANPINFQHPPLSAPPVIRSDPATRILRAELVAKYDARPFTTLHNGQQVTRQLHLRGYGGQPSGPTLIARPGDTLHIRLRNQLPPEQHESHCAHDAHAQHDEGCLNNLPHNFNTTNLHTHGLHVDPTGRGDNAFIALRHGQHFDYRIHIPDDHPAGTFWYHAHVHGATSVQVGSGMVGALIVEGDYDAVPQLRHARQQLLLLQEIAFDEHGRIENNDTYAPTIWDDEAAARGWHLAINGQVMPELRLRPGELQLWRTVHAGVRKLANLRLLPACRPQHAVPLVQLAADGIPFRHKRLSQDHGAFLTPGSRLDLAVRAFTPGVYYLVDTLERASAGPLPEYYCDQRRRGAPLQLDNYAQGILARVVVSGPPQLMTYPRNAQLARLNRPAPIEERELTAATQRVDFDIDLSHEPWLGLINGVPYDPRRPRLLKLGEAQTWYLSSAFSHHPFHIHVNPFEVIRRDSNGNIIDRFWKDTINVPQSDPNDVFGTTVEVRMRYADFSGAFFAHCHILDHSDRGMMEKIIIEP